MAWIGTAEVIRLSPRSENSRERAIVRSVAEGLQRREPALFERVLRELAPEMGRWMYHFLGTHPELDDATQEALTEVCAALHRFEGRSSVATLAHRIALRVSYRYRRSRRPPPPEEIAPMSSERPDATAEARRALAELQEHLDGLSEAYRTAIVLCGLEGLDPREAAEIVGVSANAMRVRLHRARAELASAIEVAREKRARGARGEAS